MREALPGEEVLPGLYHWAAVHPKIQTKVSSWWLADDGVLIDPLVPEAAGIECFDAPAPGAVLLSNRHHYRDSGRFAERYGARVYCNRAGLHEFTPGQQVEGFEVGAQLPGGAIACAVDAICPDDTALYLPERRALLFADGLVRGGTYGSGAPLGFVPDSLMDDPETTKRGLLRALERLLDELEFEHLLLAHGGPVMGDGRELLRDLVAQGGRTAFDL
jgi:glyoxylase-like metal-dependent hydrolase (beta-lactamase superfamily II)